MDNYIIVPDGSMNFETISEFKRTIFFLLAKEKK